MEAYIKYINIKGDEVTSRYVKTRNRANAIGKLQKRKALRNGNINNELLK